MKKKMAALEKLCGGPLTKDPEYADFLHNEVCSVWWDVADQPNELAITFAEWLDSQASGVYCWNGTAWIGPGEDAV